MASTKDVLDRHLEFFGGGDLKGILAVDVPGVMHSIATKVGIGRSLSSSTVCNQNLTNSH
jgi:hypothetical protein